MQNLEDTKPIREKLKTYESDAPEFDALFEGEVLGDAILRQLCQSKLATFQSVPPSFDQVFAENKLVSIVPKKRISPIWAFLVATAACIALVFLLPNKMQMDKTTTSVYKKTTVSQKNLTIKPLPVTNKQKIIFAQKVENPETILTKTVESLAVESNEPEAAETLDTTYNDNLEKLVPTLNAKLAINRERSVTEAYALAKIRKTRIQREKLVLGANINSSNRLLSQVNTNSAEACPLQSISKNYTTGYSSLEGSTTTLLRAATVSRNAWITPENISYSVLDDYKAVYSLPINIGFSLSIPIFRHSEIMTGINYTYLYGKTSGETFNLTQELHYLGIPVKYSFYFLKTGHFGAYAGIGGTIEKGLVGVQKSHVINTDGEVTDWSSRQEIYGIQTSFSGQIGLFYELNKTFHVYVEPGASFFIANDQPTSSRTEEPFNFNLSLGLRYRIR